MIKFNKPLLHLLQNERKINPLHMKIPALIKLLKKYEDIDKENLSNINIQIINNLNDINPNQIIKNIHQQKRGKEDLKSLQHKIYLNHLLLQQIVNNKELQKYEPREETDETNQKICIPNYEPTIKTHGRNKRKRKQNVTTNNNSKKNNDVSLCINKKEEIPDWNIPSIMINENTPFNLFDITRISCHFVLEPILQHICEYIYNFRELHQLYKKEKGKFEMVSLLRVSTMFHNFYQLKYGYPYIIHFLNGLEMYRFKENTLLNEVTLDSFFKCLQRKKEHELFQKEYDTYFIINYLHRYTEEPTENKNVNTWEGDTKNKIMYQIDLKEGILLLYNVEESFLKYFLQIFLNKYNLNKINFNNYCLVLHLYSISNHFILELLEKVPFLFLKNKTYMSVSNSIIILNSCIYFLKGISYCNQFPPFYIYVLEDTENEPKEQKNSIRGVKEKIYKLMEQIVNYLMLNKELMNYDDLLQLLELCSYINYCKSLFTYIFKQLNAAICFLNKYQILYFLNSLAHYNIICNETKKMIYFHTLKNIEQYSPKEVQLLEQYLHMKY